MHGQIDIYIRYSESRRAIYCLKYLLRVFHCTLFIILFIHFRPENTHKGAKAGYQTDLNLVYWSSEGQQKQLVQAPCTPDERLSRKICFIIQCKTHPTSGTHALLPDQNKSVVNLRTKSMFNYPVCKTARFKNNFVMENTKKQYKTNLQ